MAAYTSIGYSVADIAALKAIPPADRPAFAGALVSVVSTNQWFKFDPAGASGGIAPDSGTGRWYAMSREVLNANRTYFVRTDGNDNNTGLANTAGGAFLTIQKAIEVVKQLDLNGFTITITCIGDFTSQGNINILLPIGAGALILQGDTSNTSATIIKSVSTSGQSTLCIFYVDAFTTENITSVAGSLIVHGRIFYTIPSTGWAIVASDNGRVVSSGLTDCTVTLTSSVSPSGLVLCTNASTVAFQRTPACVFTINGNPTFTGAMFLSEGNSLITLATSTITGSFGGTQYLTPASSNGTIRKPDFSYQSST